MEALWSPPVARNHCELSAFGPHTPCHINGGRKAGDVSERVEGGEWGGSMGEGRGRGFHFIPHPIFVLLFSRLFVFLVFILLQ